MTEHVEALKLLIRQGPDTIKDAQDSKVCLGTWQQMAQHATQDASSLSPSTWLASPFYCLWARFNILWHFPYSALWQLCKCWNCRIGPSFILVPNRNMWWALNRSFYTHTSVSVPFYYVETHLMGIRWKSLRTLMCLSPFESCGHCRHIWWALNGKYLHALMGLSPFERLGMV